MRLSHKRKVAAKKAGVIPRLQCLQRQFGPSGIMQLHPGEKVVCFMGSRQRVSKSSMMDQVILDSWLQQRKVTVVTAADSSLYQRALDRVGKALRELCPGKLSGLFGSRTRSA